MDVGELLCIAVCVLLTVLSCLEVEEENVSSVFMIIDAEAS